MAGKDKGTPRERLRRPQQSTFGSPVVGLVNGSSATVACWRSPALCLAAALRFLGIGEISIAWCSVLIIALSCITWRGCWMDCMRHRRHVTSHSCLTTDRLQRSEAWRPGCGISRVKTTFVIYEGVRGTAVSKRKEVIFYFGVFTVVWTQLNLHIHVRKLADVHTVTAVTAKFWFGKPLTEGFLSELQLTFYLWETRMYGLFFLSISNSLFEKPHFGKCVVLICGG